jgi:DNA-binding Lrp family transcriptional regulator
LKPLIPWDWVTLSDWATVRQLSNLVEDLDENDKLPSCQEVKLCKATWCGTASFGDEPAWPPNKRVSHPIDTTGDGAEMTVAFVFINTEIGAERTVLSAIKKISGVEEAHVVYGIYDIVAKIAADSMDELRQIVIHRIRRIIKVLTTLTATAVEEATQFPTA